MTEYTEKEKHAYIAGSQSCDELIQSLYREIESLKCCGNCQYMDSYANDGLAVVHICCIDKDEHDVNKNDGCNYWSRLK